MGYQNNTGLTVFEKRSYKFKAGASITLAFLAIIGLFRAFQGVYEMNLKDCSFYCRNFTVINSIVLANTV